MSGVRFFVLFSALLTLVNCSPVGRSSVHKTGDADPAPAVNSEAKVDVPETVTAAPAAMDGEEWLPDWQVVCKASYCPPQVGLLVRPRAVEGGLIRFKRCTSSLVSNKWVIASGHCDTEVPGYFITQKINGKKYQRKLKSTPVYKSYVQGTINPETGKEEKISGQMDIAIFELEEEIPEEVIKPFTLASGKGHEVEKLYAYVINPSGNPNEFQIEERVCTSRRHEAAFPYSLSENPDVISTFDCELVEGNSGAPLLTSPSSTEVQSVHIGGLTAKESMDDVRKKQFREPNIYERHARQWSSNVRCAAIPGRPESQGCIRTDSAELNRRFQAYNDLFFAKINKRMVPNSSRYGFEFNTYVFQVKTQDIDNRYEVFYSPKCRISPHAPKTVDFPVENLLMKYDEWAQITLESVDVKIGAGSVTQSYSNGVHTVQVDWPAPIGEFSDAKKTGLREQWGPSFNIALPICGS